MAWKVYYTDSVFPSIDLELEELAGVGAELVVAQCETEEDIASICHDADGLIVVYAPVGRRAFAGLPNCKVVVRRGIGLEVIDLAAATEHGVCVANIPDYCVQEVSDHALALIIACNRKIVKLDRAVHAGVWDAAETMKPVGRLEDETVGIIGYGRIGQRLGRRAGALGLSVLAYDPYFSPEAIAAAGAEPVSLDELLRRADYVSINCPLTPQTHHLIGAAELRKMKPTAHLVNTSRGPVVDEAALIVALREGIIGGAALDVLEREPVPADYPLLGMDNVIITPHAAYYSELAYEELRKQSARQVARVLSGRYPRSLANPAVKERLRALGRELAED